MDFDAPSQDPIGDKLRVIDRFHRVTFDLIGLAKKMEPHNPEIDWLQRVFSLVKTSDPAFIIDTCKDKIFTYREKIRNKDTAFFLENQFDDFIKDDDNKSFMYKLINLIKAGFTRLSAAEKQYIWSVANKMLECVVMYKLLTEDYEK